MKTKSEFGRGLVYNIGLFLMHERQRERYQEMYEKHNLQWATMWFNGASDHLYEIEIPDSFPARLRNRIKRFKTKCLEWGHGFPKKEAEPKDVYWALDEAKLILRLIDKEVLKVKSIKGIWE